MFVLPYNFISIRFSVLVESTTVFFSTDKKISIGIVINEKYSN